MLCHHLIPSIIIYGIKICTWGESSTTIAQSYMRSPKAFVSELRLHESRFANLA